VPFPCVVLLWTDGLLKIEPCPRGRKICSQVVAAGLRAEFAEFKLDSKTDDIAGEYQTTRRVLVRVASAHEAR
jgi:hypothetical protein